MKKSCFIPCIVTLLFLLVPQFAVGRNITFNFQDCTNAINKLDVEYYYRGTESRGDESYERHISTDNFISNFQGTIQKTIREKSSLIAGVPTNTAVLKLSLKNNYKLTATIDGSGEEKSLATTGELPFTIPTSTSTNVAMTITCTQNTPVDNNTTSGE